MQENSKCHWYYFKGGLQLTKQALNTSVLFIWSYYSKNQDTPNYEFLKSYDYYDDAFTEKGKNEKNKNKRKWKILLDEYDFKSCDEFDLEISEAIEKNFIDKEKLKKLTDEINTNLKNGKSRDSFNAVWKNFHRSFKGDKNSFSKELIKAFTDNAEVLNPTDLNATVTLLKEIGFKEEANNLIDLFIDKHKDNKIFDLSDPIPGERITDEVLIDRFDKHYKENRIMRDLKDILFDVAQNNQTSKLDEEVILTSLSDDFYSAFMSLDDRKTGITIKECLRFCILRIADKNYKEAYKNIIKALQKIQKENDLNELRIKKMGINLDELKKELKEE